MFYQDARGAALRVEATAVNTAHEKMKRFGRINGHMHAHKHAHRGVKQHLNERRALDRVADKHLRFRFCLAQRVQVGVEALNLRARAVALVC